MLNPRHTLIAEWVRGAVITVGGLVIWFGAIWGAYELVSAVARPWLGDTDADGLGYLAAFAVFAGSGALIAWAFDRPEDEERHEAAMGGGVLCPVCGGRFQNSDDMRKHHTSQHSPAG